MLDLFGIAKTIISNLFELDFIIVFLAFLNGFFVFKPCLENTEKVYNHFNAKDSVSNLTDKQKKGFENTAAEQKKLTVQDLLTAREKANKYYAFYTNFTSIFPLLGMLGTVVSLINTVNQSGFDVSGSFFSALTSTFWGIIFAIAFKILDSGISYKIDDNEKHLEYLFNPDKGK